MNTPPKPSLTLMKVDFSEEQIAAMFKQIAGRELTPEELEEVRQEMKDMQQSAPSDPVA
jgi:hypothetical protein